MRVSDFATELREAIDALDRSFAESKADPVEYAARREMMAGWLAMSSESERLTAEHAGVTLSRTAR